MRALVQRVSRATVRFGEESSSIGPGLCCFIGIHREDSEKDRAYLLRKILNLRVFDDPLGVMNLSVTDTRGELLVISQFTLYGDTHKGNRPSYNSAMPPAGAVLFFNTFITELAEAYPGVKTGFFGEHMDVDLVNDGPVTLFLDSFTH